MKNWHIFKHDKSQYIFNSYIINKVLFLLIQKVNYFIINQMLKAF